MGIGESGGGQFGAGRLNLSNARNSVQATGPDTTVQATGPDTTVQATPLAYRSPGGTVQETRRCPQRWLT